MRRATGEGATAGRIRRALAASFVFLVVATAAAAPAEAKHAPRVSFVLTILHNNDGESELLGTADFGGAARFKSLVDELRRQATKGPPAKAAKAAKAAQGGKRGVIMLSSGDNFLAGPEFNASLEKGPPFFDTVAMDLVGYDAVAIGNHEFDFGPDVLADFIGGFSSPVPFLSANLDVSAEPRLQMLAEAGRIAESVVVKERGERIGIVGATTPALPTISSPRNVAVDPDVAEEVQAEVDELEAMGVNKIILISHLQDIQEDLELAPQLSGVDIMIAGGGDELLANEDDLLVPGDEGEVFGAYPLFATDADGKRIPVVTTSGQYFYVGRLVAGFDKAGNLLTANGGPVRVSGVVPDAVEPDAEVVERVTEPVAESIAALGANIIGTSEVDLDGRRSQVRSVETNEGNLIADALLDRANALAPTFGAPQAEVALQNGGGIRNDSIIPAGPISELHTFDMLPFPNFVSIVPEVSRAQLKALLENAVACTQAGDFTVNPLCGSGRFAQIGGLSFTWSQSGAPMIIDIDGNVIQEGTRVREATLDDGTVLITGGAVVPGPPVDVATIDFLARGGDQYPFGGASFTTVGITYQQALEDYIETTLGGQITAARYPIGGEGRIARLP